MDNGIDCALVLALGDFLLVSTHWGLNAGCVSGADGARGSRSWAPLCCVLVGVLVMSLISSVSIVSVSTLTVPNVRNFPSWEDSFENGVFLSGFWSSLDAILELGSPPLHKEQKDQGGERRNWAPLCEETSQLQVDDIGGKKRDHKTPHEITENESRVNKNELEMKHV